MFCLVHSIFVSSSKNFLIWQFHSYPKHLRPSLKHSDRAVATGIWLVLSRTVYHILVELLFPTELYKYSSLLECHEINKRFNRVLLPHVLGQIFSDPRLDLVVVEQLSNRYWARIFISFWHRDVILFMTPYHSNRYCHLCIWPNKNRLYTVIILRLELSSASKCLPLLPTYNHMNFS